MLHPETKALEIVKEIVTARMTNADHRIDKESGARVGEYFQEIYNKVLEITKEIPN